MEEFCGLINVGFAFSYQFKNSHRKKDNFICADFIALDMDGGREIDDVLNDQIVQKYGTIFYTTPSHTIDHHRFRIIFALPRTLTNIEDLERATYSLALRLGGDPKISDGARMFFGSQGSQPTLLDNILTEDYLNDLIVDGKVIPQPQHATSQTGVTTNKSRLRLNLDMQVRTSKNEWILLRDIKEKTSLYCPYHQDENPSSFVAFNDKNNMYHYCSKCCVTRWSNSGSNEFNFNDFEEQVIALKNKTSTSKVKTKRIGLETLFLGQSQGDIEINNVVIQNEKYLKMNSVNDGITFIKSPKGSGKTEFLKNYVRSYVNRYKSFDEYEADTYEVDKPIYHKERTVLLMGHRQSLIGELCERIGLHSYLDDRGLTDNEVKKKKERYGICLDSLWKVAADHYDLIIIDEVEQVISHFLSETVGSKRFRIYQIFSRLIQQANKVIVLDADTGWITFNTLTAIMLDDYTSPLPKHISIHINTHRTANQTITIFQSDKQLVEIIKRRVLEGKKIFISSNSKKRVKLLNEMLNTLSRKSKIKIPRLMVTSENSKSAEVQSFIKNVKSEILNYQVILSSPSLGTGIDISFENDSKIVDCVFGFYEVQVNNHFDIDQQLSRVRHPGEINVYISPRIFDFETDLGVVEEDIQSAYLKEISVSDFMLPEIKTNQSLSSFVKMCARIVSASRHSMNGLKINFLRLKEYQGYKIETAPSDALGILDGSGLYKKASKTLQQKEITKLIKASPLNLYDYIRYEDWISYFQRAGNDEFQMRYLKTKLELFYKEPVTKDLIKQDRNGQFRMMIRRFRSVTDHKDLMRFKRTLPTDQEQTINIKAVRDYQTGSLLLNELLTLTPLFDGQEFLADVTFTADSLTAFAEMTLNLSSFIKTQLDINIRKDVVHKPVQQLGSFLKLVGLETVNFDTKKSGDKKTYFYKLEPTGLERVLTIIDRQNASSDSEICERYGSGWDYLNEKYKFEYSAGQLNWLCPGYTDFGDLSYRNKTSNYEKWATNNKLGDN